MTRTFLAWLLFLPAVLAPVLSVAADPSVAMLSIFGINGKEIRITADKWAALPRESVDVIDHSGSPEHFEGVSGREILKLAGAPLDKELRGPSLAVFVVAEAADG